MIQSCLHRRSLVFLVVTGVLFGPSDLQGKPPPVGQGDLVSISVAPEKIEIQGRDELQQLIVTGHYSNGGARDLTTEVNYHVLDEKVARIVSQGQLESLGNGETKVTISLAGKSVTLTVKVQGAERVRPINFTNDIVPIFSKLGCNSGSCHGKSTGQNGFKLSLLGFEPRVDYDAITR